MAGNRGNLNVGQKNLRKGRYSLENYIYHVTIVTSDRKKIFTELPLGRLVVRSLIRLEHTGRASTMAFVIMPDHMHWLFQLPQDSNLSSTVGSMKSQSSSLINCHLGTSGANWQKGFHDRALRRDEDIVQVARYIVANPLRAGLTSDIGDYPHWYSIWV
jgi:REP element-mobilizing transposase RayT